LLLGKQSHSAARERHSLWDESFSETGLRSDAAGQKGTLGRFRSVIRRGEAEAAHSGNPRALHRAARGKIEDARDGRWLVFPVRLPLGMEDVALSRKTSMGEGPRAGDGSLRSAAGG